MFSPVLIVAVIGGSFLHMVSSEVFKCDDSIVKSIKKSWNGNSPNDILEKAISYKKVILKASTPKYIDDKYKGLYGYFTKEDGNVFTKESLYYVKKDGSEDYKERQLIEAGGAIKNSDNNRKRYPVYYDNGVIACYTCIDSDKAPEGPPTGFVITKESGYTKNDYQTALDKLENVGVKCTVEYSY